MIHIADSSINSNIVGSTGGFIVAIDHCNIDFIDSVFSNNEGGNGGDCGSVLHTKSQSNVTVSMESCEFTDNYSGMFRNLSNV